MASDTGRALDGGEGVNIDGLSVAVARACAAMERLQIQRDSLAVLVGAGIEILGAVDTLDVPLFEAQRAWADHARRTVDALRLHTPLVE